MEETNLPSVPREKVDEVGTYFECNGFSPLIGRIFAFLLLSEPPHQTFYAIQEFMAASKSSVSYALNDLMKMGFVEYITFEGDRKRYFRINTKAWYEEVKAKVHRVTAMKSILADVLLLRDPAKNRDFNEGIADLLEFHAFMAGELSRVIGKWEAFKNRQQSEPGEFLADSQPVPGKSSERS